MGSEMLLGVGLFVFFLGFVTGYAFARHANKKDIQTS